MKTLKILLGENKTEKERFDELILLLPSLLTGEKIYYEQDKYIYFDGENLHSGLDRYPKDSLVKGAFPYIFFLDAIYSSRHFALKIKESEELSKDKNYKINSLGLVELKDYGVVGNSSYIKSILTA